MRLVISVLRNSSSARELTRDLLQAGCQADRLLFLSNATVQLDGWQSDSPGLHFAGTHQNTSVWCVREPEYFSMRIRDACSSLALCICLLDQLQHAGQRADWIRYRDNLDKELPVSILQMPPPGIDELTMAKCVLVHAVDRLQVLDLET